MTIRSTSNRWMGQRMLMGFYWDFTGRKVKSGWVARHWLLVVTWSGFPTFLLQKSDAARSRNAFSCLSTLATDWRWNGTSSSCSIERRNKWNALFFFAIFSLCFFFSAQIALSQIVVFVYRACERKRKIRAVERRAAARGGAKKRADTKWQISGKLNKRVGWKENKWIVFAENVRGMYKPVMNGRGGILFKKQNKWMVARDTFHWFH